MKIKLLTAAVMAVFASTASAFDSFTVKDIRVEGIQRTEAGTVFNYLPVKVGETFSDERAAEAIKTLYATGFFKDVRIEIDQDVLVVVLEERPAIASIDFSGLKEFDKEAIKKGLKEVGLAESRIFDRSLLERAEQEIKRQYLSRGLYAVKITTTVTPLERNRVGVNFAITEGDAAKIRKITILGTNNFKEDDILDLMQLRVGGWLSWYTKNDQYSKQKLAADLESIRSWYMNRGFIDFNIESTQVSITPDRKDIYIAISVNEGEKYTVSSVKLAGEMVVPEAELNALIKIKSGEVYSRERFSDLTKSLTDRLGNEGYAFANVNAAPEVDKEKKEVAFTVFMDPGRRVYVNRINIGGNTRTRDEVIRREMRQMEGAWYDGERINKSKKRIDRLGFFDEVLVDTPATPGTTDQVDVNFSVKERPTGNLMLGAGFSSAEKVVLSAAVSQSNVFGTGNALSFQVNTGSINKVYSVSYTDPYYTPDGISRGFDFYKRNTDYSTSTVVAPYKTSSLGTGVRFGFPIAEDDRINFGIAVDTTEITTYDNSPINWKNFVNKFGNSNSSLILSAGWARDRRDSFIYPREGVYQRVYGEASVPPSGLNYYRWNVQMQEFFPIGRQYALMLNGDLGVANGYGGKELPFYRNFYAGGIGSVRGYDQSSLGPRNSDDTILGGNKRLLLNAEFYFPMPGSGLDKSFRLSTFLDAGQVWGKDDYLQRYDKVNLNDLRYSTGIAFSWGSPIGPLKFSFGRPLNKKDGDRTQAFQFQMGSVF